MRIMLIIIVLLVTSCVTNYSKAEELIGPPEYMTPLSRLCIRDNSVNHSFGKVRNNRTKNHQGHDYLADHSTEVYSITNTQVVRITTKGAHGLSITLFDEINSLYYRYSHLSSIVKSVGDEAYHGEVIGFVGRSGNARNLPSDQTHVHFELMTVKRPGLGLKNRKSPLTLWPHLSKYMFDC